MTSLPFTDLTDPAWGAPAFPLRFTSFRDHQIPAIEQIVGHFQDGMKTVIVDAPVGAGKTLIAEATRRALGNVMGLYTCTTKTLQDQVLEDYPYAKVLKGRGNYPTLSGSNLVTAADCTYQGPSSPCDWCEIRFNCPYEEAKREALAARLAVINTSYFLTEANGPGRFGGENGRPLVILDEADSLEGALLSFVEVDVGPWWLKKLRMKPPGTKTEEAKANDWVDWVDEALEKVQAEAARLPIRTSDPKSIRYGKRVRNLASKLAMLAEQLPEGGWVYQGYERDDPRVTFKPVKVDKLADQYLWRHGKRFLLMSGSVISADEVADSLGIEDFETVTVDVDWDNSRRPIYVAPVADVTWKNKKKAYPALKTALEAIVEEHAGERVLVHTVNYDLSRYLSENVRLNGRPVVSYTNAAERMDALETYKTTDGAVIIASSLDRGIDLPDDLCVPSGTLIRTSKGYKKVEDIEVDERVLTHTGKYRKVLETFKRDYDGEMIDVQVDGGSVVSLTPNHPVCTDEYGSIRPYKFPGGGWTANKASTKHSLSWTPAGELEQGSRVLLSIPKEKRRLKPPGVKFLSGNRKSRGVVPNEWVDSPEFWELVGLWAAEGSLVAERSKRSGSGQRRIFRSVVWSFGAHESDTLAARCADLVAKVLGQTRPGPKIYGSGCVVRIKNDAFATWLIRNIGSGARSKRVPTRLFFSPESCMMAFLDGYSEGDGYEDSSGAVITTSVSRDLSLGVRDLALRCGFKATCSGPGIYGAWNTRIVRNHPYGQSLNTTRMYRSRVEKVTRRNYEGKVYNLRVDRDESYATQDFVVHNCSVIVICKVPFPPLGDKQVSKRLHSTGRSGKVWYRVQVVRSIVQMVGRGFRHENDQVTVYILDRQMESNILAKSSRLLPRQFRDAIVDDLGEVNRVKEMLR